jgi:hypothetical protein
MQQFPPENSNATPHTGLSLEPWGKDDIERPIAKAFSCIVLANDFARLHIRLVSWLCFKIETGLAINFTPCGFIVKKPHLTQINCLFLDYQD